jgi:uncharacterized DUF497 family protein
MRFEWDEAKRQLVIAKRGIDFLDMTVLLDGRLAYTYSSDRKDEERIVTVAELNGKLFALIWTERKNQIRIITARRAQDGEERAYRQLHNG